MIDLIQMVGAVMIVASSAVTVMLNAMHLTHVHMEKLVIIATWCAMKESRCQ